MSYMHVPLIYFAEIAENAENRPWKSFITYTTYKLIFIQFYIYFNNLTVLVNGNWGWGKLGGVSVLIRLCKLF